MGKYFEKFPTISYNGILAKNILMRTRISQQSFNGKGAFVDFETTEETSRPDIISEKYYESPYYDWLYYLSNEIVNPYLDRYLSQHELTSYIKKTYGSVEYTKTYIMGYRNNWASDDTELTIEQYNNLSVSKTKYYELVSNYLGVIIAYRRKPVDWLLDNNKIQILTIAATNEMNYLAVGECYKQINTSSGETVAQGLLTGYDIENKTLTFTRITGEFQVGTEYRVFGKYFYKDWKYRIIAKSNPYVVDGVETDPISSEELQYWAPVYLYDRIIENNEEKKKVKLLRNSLKTTAEQSLKKLLRF